MRRLHFDTVGWNSMWPILRLSINTSMDIRQQSNDVVGTCHCSMHNIFTQLSRPTEVLLPDNRSESTSSPCNGNSHAVLARHGITENVSASPRTHAHQASHCATNQAVSTSWPRNGHSQAVLARHGTTEKCARQPTDARAENTPLRIKASCINLLALQRILTGNVSKA